MAFEIIKLTYLLRQPVLKEEDNTKLGQEFQSAQSIVAEERRCKIIKYKTLTVREICYWLPPWSDGWDGDAVC